MEAKGSSPQWKKHTAVFKHSTLSGLTTKANGSGKTDRPGDGGRQSSSVTMASRCLTNRQYILRKPVSFADQYTSILKKTPQRSYREKENYLGVSRAEEHQQHTNRNLLTKARTERTLESFSFSHSDILSPSFSREDINSPLSVEEVRGCLDHEEPGGRTSQLSFLSSILEVPRQNPPLRWQLTSTALNPTCTSCSGYSRAVRSHLTPGEREGGDKKETRLQSSRVQSREQGMSTHQANYWACAIPKHLPPFPDRYSTAWDPNEEYQALLDYTYPLRPGQTASEWDSSQLQANPQLQTDLNLQDSGIELDHLNSSTSLPELGLSASSAEHTRERCFPSREDRSLSSTVLTIADPEGLSVDSLDTSKDRRGLNCYKSDDYPHYHHAHSSTPAAFIRSTSVLQQSRHILGEMDEEFWPLPEQLEELQLLSKQVREVTTQLSRPVTASWKSLDPVTTSILSSPIHPEGMEGEDKEETKVSELEDYNQDIDDQKSEISRGRHRAAQTDSGVKKRSGPSIEPVKEELSQSISRKLDALVEQLCFLTLPASQRSSLANQDQSDSLMQNIQVFCSHLDQLIQQLYSMSEKMDQLVPTTLDINNMKSTLAQYQSFQRDVGGHQPLTSCVLHTGQLLLNCMTTSSLFLRDTLLLIESQSGVLENHREHIFSSILSAMDSLTQQKPVQQSKEEDSDPVGVQDSTFSTDANM